MKIAHGDHSRIASREQAEAEVQHGEPEEEHDKERHREGALRLLDHQPAGLQQVGADLLRNAGNISDNRFMPRNARLSWTLANDISQLCLTATPGLKNIQV
jgi:hypothetical protein